MKTTQWWSWSMVMWFCTSAQDPVAVLPQGRLLGIKVFPESSSTPVEIFYGIPYANPPVGRYRFSAPERHPGWRRTLFAHRPPPRCPDVETSDSVHTSEDCLYLNVWTPQRAEGSRLPVLVVLFGETWSRVGPTLAAQELAASGLVVVSVAYRLHLLGWFTLRSTVARGNLGLLDQYLALLWVRENIAVFGGDPSAVTLMGHSAGADCVLYHITSARTTGFFERAIIMSPREIWRAISDESNTGSSNGKSRGAYATERASREIAAAMGCASGDDNTIVRCMQGRTMTDILQVYNNSEWLAELRPIADDFLPESAQYVPQPLAYSLATPPPPTANRPLHILFGITDLESIDENEASFANLANRGSENLMEYATLNLIPELLRFHGLHQSPAKYMLIEAIRWEYWGASVNEGGWVSAEKSQRAVSGALWGAGGALLAARLARRARLHVYRYTQPGGVDLRGRQLNYTGAAHGTDLVALMGEAMLQLLSRRRATPLEQRLSSRLRTYLSNFVKYGSPEVEGWASYRVGAAYIHEIREPSRADSRADNRDAAFWLQHLPRLANVSGPITMLEHPEKFTGREGETRLRGAIYALSGVSAALVALLCVCVALLKRAARTNNMRD